MKAGQQEDTHVKTCGEGRWVSQAAGTDWTEESDQMSSLSLAVRRKALDLASDFSY